MDQGFATVLAALIGATAAIAAALIARHPKHGGTRYGEPYKIMIPSQINTITPPSNTTIQSQALSMTCGRSLPMVS
jgi:hypothetical protein